MAIVENFKDFSSIRISSNPVNTFAGMAIYNASLSVSPGSPTKLIIRCVEGQLTGTILEKGGFTSAIGSVSTNVSDISYPIWIGPLRIPEMYLITKESSVSSSQRVMTLTFVDKSVLLDKIFVGIIGIHSSYNDLALKNRFDSLDPTISWSDIEDLYASSKLSNPPTWTSSYAYPTDASYWDSNRREFRLRNGVGIPIFREIRGTVPEFHKIFIRT